MIDAGDVFGGPYMSPRYGGEPTSNEPCASCGTPEDNHHDGIGAAHHLFVPRSPPPAPRPGYVLCPQGCGHHMHAESRRMCWHCVCHKNGVAYRSADYIHPDWDPPVPKPSALRTWLRTQRERENAEDLAECIFEPYPNETSGVYRRDWLGAPMGPRSLMGTPILLVTLSTTRFHRAISHPERAATCPLVDCRKPGCTGEHEILGPKEDA